MKRCPKCTKLMPNDVTLCISCGFDSRLAASASIPKAPASSPATSPSRPPTPAASRPGTPVAATAKVGKIANGIALARQSWNVLMLDKSLLVFPLASGIACFLVLATFIGGALAAGLGRDNMFCVKKIKFDSTDNNLP